jgi:hypothetical protein
MLGKGDHMADEFKSVSPDASNPPNPLAELQAKQAALIKQGQELMRQLDKVTAEIAKHQANRARTLQKEWESDRSRVAYLPVAPFYGEPIRRLGRR